jgi:hypothetical protein
MQPALAISSGESGQHRGALWSELRKGYLHRCYEKLFASQQGGNGSQVCDAHALYASYADTVSAESFIEVSLKYIW